MGLNPGSTRESTFPVLELTVFMIALMIDATHCHSINLGCSTNLTTLQDRHMLPIVTHFALCRPATVSVFRT